MSIVRSPALGALPPASYSLDPAMEEGGSTGQDKFEMLDDPAEWSAFSRADVRQPEVWESNLLIEGMHCAACALSIEDALLKVPGVARAEVSAGSHRARVVWSAQQVKTGFAGVELRTTQQHGVEPTLSEAQRQEVAKRFADSGVELVGLGTACDTTRPIRRS